MPVGVLFGVVIVMVEVPFALSDVGVNVADAWLGSPVTLKVTEELNPPVIVSVMVSFTKLPRVEVTLVGDAESEKFWTVSVTVVVCVPPTALLAVIVRG